MVFLEWSAQVAGVSGLRVGGAASGQQQGDRPVPRLHGGLRDEVSRPKVLRPDRDRASNASTGFEEPEGEDRLGRRLEFVAAGRDRLGRRLRGREFVE